MAILRLVRRWFGPKKELASRASLEAAGREQIVLKEDFAREISRLFGGRSLRIRAVDAGSSGQEEIELKALTGADYDMERFGLRFVSSPRHADMLFVTGPVTRNMREALKATYDAAPQPCMVVAIGDAACTGGIWQESYAVVGPVEKVIPVHVKIPGDPPSPSQILAGLLHALKEVKNISI